MHTYIMFWIQEEFSTHYYYKSDILHQFLKECLTKDNKALMLQFQYVTKPIPFHKLLNHMKNYHQRLTINEEGSEFTVSKHGQAINVRVSDRYLLVNSETVQEADDLLFQPLTLFDPHFFIIEEHSTNSGWIAPAKKEIIL